MPTRDLRTLSKQIALPPPPTRPPEPGISARWRWSASIVLAVCAPLVFAWVAQRLGPGPHASMRIELALQRVGSGGSGQGGNRSGPAEPTNPAVPGGASQLAPTSEAEPTPQPNPAALQTVTPSPAPTAEPTASLTHAEPAATPLLAPTPVNEHTIASGQAPPPPSGAASAQRVLAAAQIPAGAAESPVAARPAAKGAAPPQVRPVPVRPQTTAQATSEAETANSTPGETGARGGPGGGSVGPESLDDGFGLATPVRLPYPPSALAQGRRGRARIEIEIDTTGRVARVTVLDETPGEGFGAAAQRGYAQARFSPPRINGKPVRVILRKTIEFEP